MKKVSIETKNAPKALGPYSQAVKSGGFVFLSGQIGIEPETGKMTVGGVKEQTRQIFKNIGNILKESMLNFDDIIKITVFLKNMDNFSMVNEIYSEFFSKPYPARSAVEVSKLPLDAEIEIESIAAIDK